MAETDLTERFAGLFPGGVCVAAADPLVAGGLLFPEEEAAVARAVEKRRQEFRAGRQCARRALAELGAPAGALPVMPSRAPRWPEGVVGSITHCAGLAAAAVAWSRDLSGLGLDAELAEPLKAPIVRLICTDAEIRWMASESPPPGTDWAKVIFSAKEAVYKCVWPVVGRWIGFLEVTIDLDPHMGRFTVQGADPESLAGVDLRGVRGAYRVSAGLVLTAAVLAAAPVENA